MANSTIEKEAKMLLTEEEFKVLITKKPFKLISQDNYYFMDDDNHMFRFRKIKDGPLIFNHKEKIDGITYEYEKEVEDTSLDNPYIKDVLKEYNIADFKYIGTLHIDRYLFKADKGEICLDKNLYNNHLDYEFEYELYNPEDEFDEGISFLKEINLDYKRNGRGKFRRFLNTLEKQ